MNDAVNVAATEQQPRNATMMATHRLRHVVAILVVVVEARAAAAVAVAAVVDENHVARSVDALAIPRLQSSSSSSWMGSY